jgi:TetR/AcrR family transcriptional regulator, regulator of cefoperazone and chloramphenicol sensitivity
LKQLFQLVAKSPLRVRNLLLLPSGIDLPTRRASSKELPKPDRLVEVAGEIFAKRGFAATVREICREAQCSVAAVNYYFGDKQQLYLRCVQAACEKKERLFPLPALTDCLSAAERLERFVEVMARRILSEQSLSWQNTLMLREILSPTPGVEAMLQVHFRPGFEMLTSLLGELLGSFNSLENREQLAWQIIARCMFLRTGRHLHALLSQCGERESDSTAVAAEICSSIFVYIRSLSASGEMKPCTSAIKPPKSKFIVAPEKASKKRLKGKAC